MVCSCFIGVDFSGNLLMFMCMLPLLWYLSVSLVLHNCCVGERGERARIAGDNAHIKEHGRRHANSNLSISL